jgi:hypothetical protein
VKLNSVISSLIVVSILSGCAGRDAKVVQAIQSGDDTLNCPQILDAMVLNTKEIEGLAKERNGDIAGNVAATVTGVFFIVPLLFIDAKNAASQEARGLVRRNQVLAERYHLKNCSPKIEEYTENRILLDTNYSKLSIKKPQ